MPRHPAPTRSSAHSSRVRPPSPDLRVTGPAELVQAVPFLIGFHPHHSLVLVGLHDRALVVTARMDLPSGDAAASSCTRPAAPRGADDLTHAVRVLLDAGVTEIVALVYDGSVENPGIGELLAALPTLTGDMAHILDVLSVASGRWRSLSCSDTDCCPAEGRPIDDHTSAFAAAATVAGMVVQPDRSALTAVLEPAPAEVRERARDLVRSHLLDTSDDGARRATTTAVRRLFAAARRCERPGEALPDTASAARLASYLRTIEVRDAVWLGIDDGRLDGRPLWAHLARVVPPPYDAAPAFLYGWAAWRSGNGALAGVAVERALASDPAYSAADLLAAAIARGIDPARVPRLRRPRATRRSSQATRTKT